MHRLTPSSECDNARITKACLPCAQVKARCEVVIEDETCKRYISPHYHLPVNLTRTRCRRLNKTCSGQPPGAHRRKKLKTSEVARLEEKLDGVTAILAASHRTSSGVGGLPPSNPVDLSPAAWIDQFIQRDLQGEMLLQTFRREIQSLFPFIVIPTSTTYLDLREEKPFLVLAVVMVGCRRDQALQTAIAKRLREIISHNILIKGEKSLDMLQSLLVYVNW